MEPEILTSWQAAKEDEHSLAQLLETHGNKLLKVASRVAKPQEMDPLLDVANSVDHPNAELTVLYEPAMTPNAPLFEWSLQYHIKPTPEYLHNSWISLYALSGGVSIWRALLAYNHDIINWQIGEHGDALGQAVANCDSELVRFLHEEGIDVKQANYVGLAALPTARGVGAGPEIIELLEASGGPEDIIRSLVASGVKVTSLAIAKIVGLLWLPGLHHYVHWPCNT